MCYRYIFIYIECQQYTSVVKDTPNEIKYFIYNISLINKMYSIEQIIHFYKNSIKSFKGSINQIPHFTIIVFK